jgi:hypothetical protein
LARERGVFLLALGVAGGIAGLARALRTRRRQTEMERDRLLRL